MYRATVGGSTTGKSGARYQYNAGQLIPDAPKGELDHVASIEWDTSVTPTLPKDLPGRAEFLEAGIETIDQIRDLEDPTEIDGIGPKTAKDLAEYLAGEE